MKVPQKQCSNLSEGLHTLSFLFSSCIDISSVTQKKMSTAIYIRDLLPLILPLTLHYTKAMCSHSTPNNGHQLSDVYSQQANVLCLWLILIESD